MAAQSDSAEPRTGERVEVPDPDGYRQQRRIKDILDARKRVLEKKRDAEELYHLRKGFGEFTRDTLLRNAVGEYISEIEWLARDPDVEVSHDYWREVKLGTQHLPNGETIEFRGLESIPNTPDPIVVRWQEQGASHTGGADAVPQQATAQIDKGILMNGFRWANGFLADLGVKLELEKDTERIFGFEVVDDE